MNTKTCTNRILSLLLAAVMTFGMFAVTPVTVRAAGETITLSPSSTTANHNDTVNFTATGYVLGGSEDSSVVANTTWNVGGNNCVSTTISGSSDSANLTIGADETAAYVIVVVASTNYSVSQNATVNITQPSCDATFQTLTVSPGMPSPAFNANTTSNTISIDNSVTSITVTATFSIVCTNSISLLLYPISSDFQDYSHNGTSCLIIHIHVFDTGYFV